MEASDGSGTTMLSAICTVAPSRERNSLLVSRRLAGKDDILALKNGWSVQLLECGRWDELSQLLMSPRTNSNSHVLTINIFGGRRRVKNASALGAYEKPKSSASRVSDDWTRLARP